MAQTAREDVPRLLAEVERLEGIVHKCLSSVGDYDLVPDEIMREFGGRNDD